MIFSSSPVYNIRSLSAPSCLGWMSFHLLNSRPLTELWLSFLRPEARKGYIVFGFICVGITWVRTYWIGPLEVDTKSSCWKWRELSMSMFDISRVRGEWPSKGVIGSWQWRWISEAESVLSLSLYIVFMNSVLFSYSDCTENSLMVFKSYGFLSLRRLAPCCEECACRFRVWISTTGSLYWYCL